MPEEQEWMRLVSVKVPPALYDRAMALKNQVRRAPEAKMAGAIRTSDIFRWVILRGVEAAEAEVAAASQPALPGVEA